MHPQDDFIWRRMEQLGLTQNRFAEMLGQSPQTISNWRKRGVPAEHHTAIADVLGCSLDEITGRTAARDLAAPRYFVRSYPVVSSITAGAFSEAVDPYPPGTAEEWLPGTRDAGPRGYWLRVEGDSMTGTAGRSYPAGCLVLVDPRRRGPVHGDIVVARREGEDRVTLKQFIDEDGHRWLRPLNPQYPAIIERFTILGTVIAKLEQ